MHTPRPHMLLLALAGLAAALSSGALAQQTAQPPMHDTSDLKEEATAPATTQRQHWEHRYREHITTLANPFMEGRAPGTRGNRIAAEYIESWYTRLGLLPAFSKSASEQTIKDATNSSVDEHAHLLSAGGERTYRQAFVAPLSRRPGDSVRIERQTISYQVGQDTLSLAPGAQYNILGYSGSATVANAPLVFVGYAIEDDDSDYDSFEGLTGDAPLAGKIAVMLRFEPLDEHGKSRLTDDGRFSPLSGIDRKFRRVIDKGAAGILLVNPPGVDDPRADRLEDLSYGLSERGMSVPIAMLSADAADALLKAADQQGRGLTALRTLADSTGGVIDLPGTTLTLDTNVVRNATLTDNVGAVLPGVGHLASEWIVIGSHYDHVGYGYFGSREPEKRGTIHPGADDNASGTSGNLLLAERVATALASDTTPRRSILFLCFSAEESGLNGARFYTRHPVAPIKETHALMFNLDMIGRIRDNKVEVNGTGTGAGLEDWCNSFFSGSHLNLAAKRSGLGPSDHNVFALANVPVLFFFSGLHNEYHKTSDTSDLINVPGAVDLTDLLEPMILAAARREGGFPFVAANGRAPTQANDPHAAANDDQPQQGSVSGVGVRFGIAPGDYSGEEPGVLVGEVFPGMPADKAGLKSGDLMTSWNGKKIASVEEWMPLLSTHKPGDEVTIVFKRGGTEQTTKTVLVARERPQAR